MLFGIYRNVEQEKLDHGENITRSPIKRGSRRNEATEIKRQSHGKHHRSVFIALSLLALKHVRLILGKTKQPRRQGGDQRNNNISSPNSRRHLRQFKSDERSIKSTQHFRKPTEALGKSIGALSYRLNKCDLKRRAFGVDSRRGRHCHNIGFGNVKKIGQGAIYDIDHAKQKYYLQNEWHQRQHRAVFCLFKELSLLLCKGLAIVMIPDLQHIHLGLYLYH